MAPRQLIPLATVSGSQRFSSRRAHRHDRASRPVACPRWHVCEYRKVPPTRLPVIARAREGRGCHLETAFFFAPAASLAHANVASRSILRRVLSMTSRARTVTGRQRAGLRHRRCGWRIGLVLVVRSRGGNKPVVHTPTRSRCRRTTIGRPMATDHAWRETAKRRQAMHATGYYEFGSGAAISTCDEDDRTRAVPSATSGSAR